MLPSDGKQIQGLRVAQVQPLQQAGLPPSTTGAGNQGRRPYWEGLLAIARDVGEELLQWEKTQTSELEVCKCLWGQRRALRGGLGGVGSVWGWLVGADQIRQR